MLDREKYVIRRKAGKAAQRKRLFGDDFYYRYGYAPSPVWALDPLIKRMQEYDDMRMRLEKQGGHLTDIKGIAALLDDKILINADRFKTHHVTLANHASIYTMLNDIGNFDIHFDVRRLDTGMPVYYLCRTRKDYWAEYSLIVHDLYMSPGYPMNDERFVKLTYFGHEVYYLRLSHFREAVSDMLLKANNDLLVNESDVSHGLISDLYDCCWTKKTEMEEPEPLEDLVDEILYKTGRHVFQAAWHEDQRLGVLVANNFGLESFRYGIELLYLCLSGELCELRIALNDAMLVFFDEVYHQPAIRGFLNILPGLDGKKLTAIPQKALKLYERLSMAFNRFLGIEVEWGHHKAGMPLYKILYGNFSRLDLVAKELKHKNKVEDEAACLESEARRITEEILDHCSL